MKIIKKTKQYVKDNWPDMIIPVVTGLACVAAGYFGYRKAFNNVTNYVREQFGFDLTKDGAYACCGTTLTTLGMSDDVLAKMSTCGFNDVNEKINVTILFQKQK